MREDVEPIVFVTGNPNKVKQIARYVDYPITHQDVELTEIQPDAKLPIVEQLEIIVRQKVADAYTATRKPTLVNDDALAIHAHHEWPGVNVKYELATIGPAGICRIANMQEDRSAAVHSMLVYHNGKQIHLFHGKVDGKIADIPLGEGGFGWDKVFIPEGYDKTRGELTAEDYDATSPRKRAAIKFEEYLKSR